MLATMVPLSVLDSLAFLPLDCIRFRCFYHQMQTSDSPWSTWYVQTYFSWHMWRGRGRDQVDWGQGEPPTLYDTGLHHQPILPPFDFLMNFDWSRFSTSKYEIILVIFFRRELPIFWASVSRLPTWHRPLVASPSPCGIGMKLKEGQFTEENLRYGVFFPSIGSIYEVSHMRLLKSEDHRWFLMSCKISEQQKWPSSFLQSSYFFINSPLRSKWCPWNLPAVGQD